MGTQSTPPPRGTPKDSRSGRLERLASSCASRFLTWGCVVVGRVGRSG
jgi:hypothetical protein